MISRVSGKLLRIANAVAVVDIGSMSVDVHVPRSAEEQLAAHVGAEISLHTVFYLEGNAVGANFVPRLLGFLDETEREFFTEFTRVKGIGMRKALRAMSVPAHHIADAIESADERMLSKLPEIGKKTAAQIITDLRGKLGRFVEAAAVAAAPAPRDLSDSQRVAIDILVQWGDRRADAERLVATVTEMQSTLRGPDEIVKAAYRLKASSAGR